jgi:hypothetical protein
VRATTNEDNLHSMLEKTTTEHSADATRAVDHISHPYYLVFITGQTVRQRYAPDSVAI